MRRRSGRHQEHGQKSSPFAPKEKRMKSIGLTLLTLLLLTLPGWSTALKLFVIQRNNPTTLTLGIFSAKIESMTSTSS